MYSIEYIYYYLNLTLFRGGGVNVTPPMGQNAPTGAPQSNKAICFIHLQQNQSTCRLSLK